MDKHIDPPCLTQTMINALVRESPMHAWCKNRHLNPNYVPEVSPQMDIGTIAHAMLLQGQDIAEPIDFGDYRSGKAQEERDGIRARGKIPVLAKDLRAIEDMVEAAQLQLEVYESVRGGFVNGDAELELVWTDVETSIRCKAKLDYLQRDRQVILDYKTTGGSAHPDVVSRQLFDRGYDIQGCWYIRAVAQLGIPNMDPDPEFFLVTQEVREPYALSVVGLSDSAKWYGDQRCIQGMRLWKECISTGIWPGYVRETVWAKLPPWLEKQQLEKMEVPW